MASCTAPHVPGYPRRELPGAACPSRAVSFDYEEKGAAAPRKPGGHLMKYLFLLHTAEGLPEDQASEAYARMHADYSAAMAAMAQAGVLIECAPLRPVSSAT